MLLRTTGVSGAGDRSEGVEIKPCGALAASWRKRLKSLNVEEIGAGDSHQGWVVFHIPEGATVGQFVFDIKKIDSPFSCTRIGSLKIPL